jgi:hypothetical protein
MGTQGAEQTGANTGNPVERRYRPKGAVGIPVCDDCLGQRQAHSRQARQLCCRSSVGIQTLTGTEWPPLPHGAVTLRCRRAGWQQREKLHLTRRIAGFGNQIPDTLARYGKGDEHEHRSAFGTEHGKESTAGRQDCSKRNTSEMTGLSVETLLSADQRHRHVAHDLKAGGADFVDRVFGRMPGGIIEVDDVDGPDTRLLKFEMIIDECVPWR